jgi:hypothetical protein
MTLRLQPTGEHLDKGGLSRATCDQIPYAQDRDRQSANTGEATRKNGRTQPHHPAIYVGGKP